VDELADSRGLAGDPVALRARLGADGYVFLRGLLPAERVRTAGERVAAALRAGGWTAAGSPLLGRAAGPREALADPAYRAAVTSLAFNALPYLTPLRETVRRILGPGAFSYPVKVLRAVAQESPAEMILGPTGQPPELFSRLLRREPWWEPVPAGLTLRPRGEFAVGPPGPSQLFAVHPSWQRKRSRPRFH
jgi:hypothetical protein